MKNSHRDIKNHWMTPVSGANLLFTGDHYAQQFLKLANYRMPFGKYKGELLIDLPEPYVVWFAKQGFPKGELGQMLGILYEIKLNGLEYLFEPLRKNN